MNTVNELDLLQDVAVLTEQIMNIESVSGNEQEIADQVHQALLKLEHLQVHRDQDAIVARTNFGRERRVVLAGHLDTVPLPRTKGAKGTVPAQVIDGVLYGRGATDMKGGVAVQLALAAELTDAKYDVTYVFYDHEEVEAAKSGLGRLAKNSPELLEADFAILLEPTNGTVEGGCNGTSRFVIRTRGKAAHSGRAWMGHNAIHDAAPILQRLSDYEPQTITVEGLDYREGMNAVRINGGIAGNVIPDYCEVEINYRFAPDKTLAEAQALVFELFDGFEIERTDGAEGAKPGLDQEIAADLIKILGQEPKPKYGWTDVSRFSALGVSAVNFGPGDALLAHSDDEHVAQDDIRTCLNSLRAWLS
ncbi:succinyl-diaminopimelate desuccinylase [Glutamicibacter halophytocola]|uniref:succinyl-diaminopimelate desuccinylase n=1 Tax=Glutamicibacter halophytocola TaxID=1933880 RepID=UPI0015C563F2|nr:succinyl-diaminopimelate desuccinylase [Glutamicibacter halophytocola]NQD42652.1 succinyl-diaminopimelate desuccinylase [Glutamicibacter halophytocola]